MFNEKVLCLFRKDTTQLVKEANRRGISQHKNWRGNSVKNREELIAEILYKDAYDAGKNDAMQNCPLKQSPQTPPVTYDTYCLYDIDEDRKYRMELTAEQASVFEWLVEHDFLTDMEFDLWTESFEDVGRI